MALHISLLVIIALSPHLALVCLIFGVITSYKICKVNYICFVKLGHFDKHFIKKPRKKAPQGEILEFFLLDNLKTTF